MGEMAIWDGFGEGGRNERCGRERIRKKGNLWRGGTRRSYTDAHHCYIILSSRVHINKIGSIIFEGSTEHITETLSNRFSVSKAPPPPRQNGVSTTRVSASPSATSSSRTRLFLPSTSHRTPTPKFETHLKFFTFEDIPICPTHLSRATRDRSIKATCSELRFEQSIDLGVWAPAVRQTSPGHRMG